MSEVTILTAAFLAIATPLFIAVGVIAKSEVGEYRHAMLLHRSGN